MEALWLSGTFKYSAFCYPLDISYLTLDTSTTILLLSDTARISHQSQHTDPVLDDGRLPLPPLHVTSETAKAPLNQDESVGCISMACASWALIH